MAIDDNTIYGLKGSQIKEQVAEIKKRAVSVDGDGASHVLEADNLHTTTGVNQTDAFIFRTTAGDASISTGQATLLNIAGKTIQTGHADESLTHTDSFVDSGTTVEIDSATFKTQISTSGVYTFSYDGSDWKLSDNTVNLATYGITVTGTVSSGDEIVVNYTAIAVGTLTTATPTSFVSNGFNQYDATAGYAHVKGDNQYRIDGTYTSLGFTETIGGTTELVTVTDGKFTPPSDGYIYVTGASGDILIALVWSGIRDNDPYEAYEASTITIPTADASSTALPTASYGMPSVGDVRDELSFVDKIYTQRIGHYDYSAENLATVEALGVDYIYDLTDIFYVLAEPITYTLDSTVSGTYIANDFGTEEFIGTEVEIEVILYYGNNLVDKLRNLLDIQSLGSGLTLIGSQLSAVAEPTIAKKVEVQESDLVLQYSNVYYYVVSENLTPGWYLFVGDFRNNQKIWHLRFGTSGRIVEIQNNAFYDHQFLVLILPKISGSSGSDKWILYADHNSAGKVWAGAFNSNTYLVEKAEAYPRLVEDSLTSTSSETVLSAKQGNILNNKILSMSIPNTEYETLWENA